MFDSTLGGGPLPTLFAPVRRPGPGLAIIQFLAAAIVVLALAQGQARAQAAETVSVTVDHAKVMRLPEKAQTVIVGNPMIADIAVQKNGVMVVTGKSFGVTNLIALDASGNLLAESFVQVRAATDQVMTVHRGLERESYSCTPICQPSIQLGDVPRFFGATSGQANERNNLARGNQR